MINDELVKLLVEVYNQGYSCGISDDDWYKAYASHISSIFAGKEYSDEEVYKEFKLIKAAKSVSIHSL